MAMSDVFVGFVFDDEKEAELLATSKRGVASAANQYQKGFLSGLSGNLQILTALSIPAFPKQNSRLIFRRESKQIPMGMITYLPFFNLYLIRDKMFEVHLFRELKKTISKQERTTIYVYSLHLPFLRAMRRLKKEYGNRIHYCLIIPDLAGKYGLVRRGIKGIKDRLDAKKKMFLPNFADSFVFLTEATKDLFAPKPYAVIEGFLPQCAFNYENLRVPKSVLYTGSLNRAYGFGTLLDAFSSVPDEDAQLWICGAGDMEEEIKRAAKRDARIHFKGFLPKSEIADLQTRCDVLVNPRTDEGEYTKYSFPSKTMEYLLSGSKVVMHRLPGIGEEYYRYIITPEDTSVEAMACALQKAWADKTFYRDRTYEQINWIKQNKNEKQQVAKAMWMLGRNKSKENGAKICPPLQSPL